MKEYLLLLVIIMVLILLIGLWRVLSGPTASDRMLAAQLFGTAGVSILLLTAVAQQQPALLNIALVLAMLAPLTLIAFVKLQGSSDESG